VAKKIGIVRFPGTNCDRDVWEAVKLAQKGPIWLWHEDQFDVNGVDAIVVPGGFSYGDYLRAGALAARSPVMKSIREGAEKGIPILGICNGFQILCEAQLLPGALVRNEDLRFVDRWVNLEVVNGATPWSRGLNRNRPISLPVAHGEGRYFASTEVLRTLEDQEQIWLRYQENINGSFNLIAGVMNQARNVVGLMPHPERAIASWMGGRDGLSFFADL
jgi:phosphoribosylformylglycinamidine synthase